MHKAAGIDNIPAEVLKNDTAVDILVNILRGYFNLGRVPIHWNSGVFHPILKPGSDDDRLSFNYRRITLISVPCEIYCYILNKRLKVRGLKKIIYFVTNKMAFEVEGVVRNIFILCILF